MAINFPNNPSLNQTYSAGDRTWFWNGTYWQQQSTTIGYSGSQGFTGSRGAATVLKGSVATEQDLPIPYGGDIGDGFLVESTGFVWLWDGSSWDVFGRFTGYTGSRGVGILDVDIINNELILTYSDSTQENLGRIVGYDGSSGFTGSRGEAGTSFAIKGSVPTPQDLPDPYFGDIGDGFIVESTGDLYVWDGGQWFNAGQIVGPQGFTGSQGQDGIIGVDGFTGSQGDQGYTGSKGEQGNFGGVTFDYTFLANTDSSLAPGDGNLKFNDLNMFSATELYIGDTDDNTVNLDNYLATIDASTSELKGHFRISRKSRPEDFVIFAITGVSVDAGEYFVVPCAFLSGQLTDSSTTFEQDDDILITFARTGDKGDTGFVGSRGDTGFSGSQGAPGTSFAIKGSVPTPQDLPDPYFGDIGDGFIVESTGDLYVWDGSLWFNAGQIVGPQGFTGSQGDLGYAGSQGDLGYTGSQGESTFTWGPTAPVNPAVGDRWYDTKRGFLVVYVDDGDSLQWVEVSASGFLGQQGYTGSGGGLRVQTVTYVGQATAADTQGGETLGIVGGSFNADVTVYVDSTECVTTVLDSSNLTFTSPAKSAGIYDVVVYSTDGSSGIKPKGIVYSGSPVWVTQSSLTAQTVDSPITIILSATSNSSVTYFLQQGSSLPAGVSLSSSGVITGTVTGITGDTAYTFTVVAIDAESQTTPRSFSFTVMVATYVEYVIIAGGGGGSGHFFAGGGGAGGYRSSVNGESSGGGASAENAVVLFPPATLTVTVGAGGAGGSANITGTSGSNSVFSTVTSIGGGNGGGRPRDYLGPPYLEYGVSGGSGGGGAGANYYGDPTTAGGAGTSNQGFAGGSGATIDNYYGGNGGGGGGAGQAGGNASGDVSGVGGIGGIGVVSSITGSAVTRGGGGGGAAYITPPNTTAERVYGTGGAGGAGGGGNASPSGGSGSPGTANTGGGGGGGERGEVSSDGGNSTEQQYATITGGSGGSGVVIIAYPASQPALTTISAGLTYDQPTRAGYRVYRFTQGTGNITF